MDIFRISPDPDLGTHDKEESKRDQADTYFKGIVLKNSSNNTAANNYNHNNNSNNDDGANSPLYPGDDDDNVDDENANLRYSQKLVDMMFDFSLGFDPASFASRVTSSRPFLKVNLFPGSFAHLLLILLEPWVDLQKSQESMVKWLADGFPNMDMNFPAPSRPTETNITDQTFFVAEIEMLRKLLAPLREDSPLSPVFWINTRPGVAGRMCEQLDASSKAIDEFKCDVAAILAGMNDTTGSIYSSLPVGWKRMSLLSKRQLRMDACRATLFWEGFSKTDLDFTSFFHFYKDHMCKLSPDRAVKFGWLPPSDLHLPQPLPFAAGSESSIDTATTCTTTTPVSSNPSDEDNDNVRSITDVTLNLMFDTVRWLALARGLSAVHLFCDVARLFSGLEPPANADRSRLELLHYFSQIRVTSDSIPIRPTTPFPWQDRCFANRNPDYFVDLWKSSRSLANDIFQNVSLLDRRRNRVNSDLRLGLGPAGGTRDMFRLNLDLRRMKMKQDGLSSGDAFVDARFDQFLDRRASLPEWFKAANHTATPLTNMSNPVNTKSGKKLDIPDPNAAAACSPPGRTSQHTHTRTPSSNPNLEDYFLVQMDDNNINNIPLRGTF